jgi:hypothetical protein
LPAKSALHEQGPSVGLLGWMTWRFDNRKNPYLFRDTMLRLIHYENFEYKELIA